MAGCLTKYTISNSGGLAVTLFNFGARVNSISITKDQKRLELLYKIRTDANVLLDKAYIGATCGPVCNRISNGSFTLNEEEYILDTSDGLNCLHSGENSLSFQYWKVMSRNKHHIRMEKFLNHLEDGFPGNRKFTVVYSVDARNRLSIFYTAVTDQDTPINITNHAYFNLGEQNILDLDFKLNATHFLERNADGIPTGRLLNIKNYGINLSSWHTIGAFIESSPFKQIKEEQGIDHCFVLEADRSGKPSAELRSNTSGVELKVYSDQPAIQMYTGHHLQAPFSGVCLESQAFTNAVNQPNFPTVFLLKDKVYKHRIIYEFDLESF